jgi:hypothetical protein
VDPDNAPPELDDAKLAALIAEAREITAAQARAAQIAAGFGHTGVLAAVASTAAGRRGRGMPGSEETFPGEYVSPAAGFATGKPPGRELPPAQVLAADQRVSAWAKQLRKAGLEGSMDQLRARAFMDILLGTDSRPRADGTVEPPAPAPAGPVAGVIPPGFAGRVALTIPAITLTGLADRSGRGRYGWSMSMWRLTAAAMAAKSPSSELTIRSPRRRAPSTTLASTVSVTRARPARVPVALALVSSRASTSHPASSRASCA